MSAFQKAAVQRLIDKATDLGVNIPPEVAAIVCADRPAYAGATVWARANPGDDEPRGCCWGDINRGPAHCICWKPVFDVDQAPPVPLASPDDLEVQKRMCGDCAYRKGSPERADEWSEEALFSLAATGKPFWCHEGMRRPVRYEHPDGRTVAGTSDDWQPPMLGATPYRTDGRPGLLCAGWAARAAHP